MIFGFVVAGASEKVGHQAAACAEAIKPVSGGRLRCHRVGDAVVGQWVPNDRTDAAGPAISDDGKRFLWFEGEAFAGAAELGPLNIERCQSLEFRRRLLEKLDSKGWSALRDLDGDFAVVVWDEEAKRLSIAVDRFGLQRIFWSEGPEGFAFGSNVSAVLVGLDRSAEPDLDALRMAVSAGGYPLAPHTYVRNVRLVPPHSAVAGRVDGAVGLTRYWSWSELSERPAPPTDELIDRSETLWREAMSRRMADARRFLPTLSGGLDSRLILDEGTRQGDNWIALSYGIAGCDDCEYAQSAAAAANVRWAFHPLYSRVRAPWIERRLEWVLRTDGLVDFGNLLHTEVIDLIAATGDVLLHGYIGDFVCGPTYQACQSIDDLVLQMPFYGGTLGWTWNDYAALLDAARSPGDYDLRFVHCEQKFVAHTNALFTSIHHVARLRRPFVDHRFFDFWQSLPTEHRDGRTYRSWLQTKHARLFRDIPWQKTGLTISAEKWRVTLERARRLTTRMLKRGLTQTGIRTRPRQRQFFDDEFAMRVPEARDLVRRTVLGPDGIAANAWNRSALQDLIDQWHERAAAPVQQIGALMSFEYYHRELPAQLRRLRATAPFKEVSTLSPEDRAGGQGNVNRIVELVVR